MLSWDYEAIKTGVEGIVEMMKHEVNDAQFLPDVNGQPMIVINVADKGKADNMIGKIDHELRQSRQLRFDMTCSSGGGEPSLWKLLHPHDPQGRKQGLGRLPRIQAARLPA
jgi:hypothetical protein